MKYVVYDCESNMCQNSVTKVDSVVPHPYNPHRGKRGSICQERLGVANGTENDDEDGRVQISDFLHLCTSGDEERMLYLYDKYF